MKTYILDASVIVKWYASEKESDLKKAEKLFFDLEQNKIIAKTSDLLIHELTNALLKGKRFGQKEVTASLKTFFQTKVEIVPTSLFLVQYSIPIAIKYNLTAYDAIYVALAKNFECQLISANPKCHGKIKDESVVSLKNYLKK
ncbi:type II toxin-antitoxin system VapC family toxin [Candidatus Shapirobacteria bacterium]|nr:type II toxin-antitoxin system VapC family toxin [Candidatus Shapirobacteria bacterium]